MHLSPVFKTREEFSTTASEYQTEAACDCCREWKGRYHMPPWQSGSSLQIAEAYHRLSIQGSCESPLFVLHVTHLHFVGVGPSSADERSIAGVPCVDAMLLPPGSIWVSATHLIQVSYVCILYFWLILHFMHIIAEISPDSRSGGELKRTVPLPQSLQITPIKAYVHLFVTPWLHYHISEWPANDKPRVRTIKRTVCTAGMKGSVTGFSLANLNLLPLPPCDELLVWCPLWTSHSPSPWRQPFVMG